MDNVKLEQNKIMKNDALDEERVNLNKLHTYFKEKSDEANSKITVPRVATCSHDSRDDWVNIQCEKCNSEKYQNTYEKMDKYASSKNLFCGHSKTKGSEYFFTDDHYLATTFLDGIDKDCCLINIDDEQYIQTINDWRFPKNDNQLLYSRDIILENKQVKDINIKYDIRNEFFSDYTDEYLRNALLRHKKEEHIQSIILTIQRKQNEIRTMKKSKSIIVQGCAGSGKTMILLHRLRFLLYNDKQNMMKYAVLVPSDNFRNYIKDNLNEFGIKNDNVYLYQEFYRNLAGKSKMKCSNESESIYSDELLKRVYSDGFIHDCFNIFCDDLCNNFKEIILLGEQKRNNTPILDYEAKIKEKRREVTKEINSLLETVSGDSKEYIAANYGNLEKCINSIIKSFNKEINKLEKFIKRQIDKENFEGTLKEQEVNRRLYKSVIFNSITVEEFNNIIDDIKDIYKNSIYEIKEYEKIDKNNNELDKGLELLKIIYNKIKNRKNKIINIWEMFEGKLEILHNANNQIIEYYLNANTKTKNELKKISFFKDIDKKFYTSLSKKMFNICKKEIKKEFNIKINNKYKCYWYLYLYSKCLNEHMNYDHVEYVFIDEAQDLSLSEINLLKKISKQRKSKFIFNLFGDTNQMITKHGISDWNKVKGLGNIYQFDENFRNTNEIIDYCNSHLSFSMKKIGVSMDSVSEFNNIYEVGIKIDEKYVFIVKDEYNKMDLEQLMNNIALDYKIYTAKEAKGLEFKTIYVFEEDMNEKERYIAYTRATIKLNVIHTLGHRVDRNKSLIVEDKN